MASQPLLSTRYRKLSSAIGTPSFSHLICGDGVPCALHGSLICSSFVALNDVLPGLILGGTVTARDRAICICTCIFHIIHFEIIKLSDNKRAKNASNRTIDFEANLGDITSGVVSRIADVYSFIAHFR